MKHSAHRFSLASGAQGLVINVPGSNVVGFEVRFNSGYQFADHSTYEMPHVMEHVLASETSVHSGPNEFMIEVQKNGAYMNASTSARYNGYTYECAAFELDRVMDLLEEQLTRPLFTDAKLAVERANVKEELLRNTTQHGSVCALGLMSQTAPWLWMDYPERIKQLPLITAEACQAHYNRTHVAANAHFVVAGNFADGGAGIVARFEHLFEKLPTGKPLLGDRRVGLAVPEPIIAQREIDQIYYRFVRSFGELDQAGRAALVLLRNVLVGGMASRVMGEARRRGLAYGVGGMGHAEPGNSTFGFTGYVSGEHAKDLFEVMGRHTVDIAQGNLRPDELAAAKQLVVGSVLRSTQTAGDLLGWYIEPFDDHDEVREFDRELKRIQAVEPQQLATLAARILDEGKFAASFVGKVGEKQAQSLAAALGEFATK